MVELRRRLLRGPMIAPAALSAWLICTQHGVPGVTSIKAFSGPVNGRLGYADFTVSQFKAICDILIPTLIICNLCSLTPTNDGNNVFDTINSTLIRAIIKSRRAVSVRGWRICRDARANKVRMYGEL